MLGLHRLGFAAPAQLTPWREFRARRESRTIDRASQRRTQFIGEERRRTGDTVENLGLKLRVDIALHDEVLDKLVRGERSVREHLECEVVFVLSGVCRIAELVLDGGE